MRRDRFPLTALLLGAPLFSAWPLHAQSPPPDKPSVRPIRDVVVEYQLLDADGPNDTPQERTITVNWAKGGALMRIQMEGQRSYVVLNRDTDRMTMVLLDEHGYVDQPFDPKRQTGFAVPTNVPLVRGETSVVSGNSCTLWHAQLGYGDSSVCVTSDGVLLSAKGYNLDHRGDLMATSVSYGPQPATVFDPPEGFQKLAIAAAAAAAPTSKPPPSSKP
jgi:hypothetical protein